MTTTAPSPRAPRTLTRDDIVRMGQGGSSVGGRPWEFLPIAMQALRQVPGDIGLRLITAANFVRLGLRTAAADQLAAVPEQVIQSPDVVGLVNVVRGLPSDVIGTADRIAMCRANLEALGNRGPGTGADFDRWAAKAADATYCRASDGNVIHRPVSGGAEAWQGLSDQRTAAAHLARDHFSPSKADFERPIYLEGVDPPWILRALTLARPRQGTGHTPPITVLQADSDQFFDGLSIADLRDVLTVGNIVALVGPDASIRLKERLLARVRFQIAGPGITTMLTRARLSPPISEVLPEVMRHQEEWMAELKNRTATIYAATNSSWRLRFEQALAGGDPLRILIPTTRYSTFVQHASRDLCRGLEAIGHKARVLIEPDDATKFAAPAYLAEIESFRPDLVVLINYPRVMMGDALPANIPFVCWLQDAMPHLFDAAIGRSQGNLDFSVGHLFDELFDKYGYPRKRAMAAGLVADEKKFHTGPVTSRAKFECEVAYVSHQSEHPQAQHERLRSEFGGNPLIVRAMERLKPQLEREAFKPLSDLAIANIHELAADAIRTESGQMPDPKAVDILTRAYCQPHMDRLLRHQTLEWAAAIAVKRGWRFKLYGNGWEKHPRLAAHASGPLEHGDDLRSSFQAAAVHLHVMSHALVHQRLIECILSGGFPMCRIHVPERWSIVECLTRLGVRQGAKPLELNDPTIPKNTHVVQWADAPALMQLASAMQRLGLFDQSFPLFGGSRIGPYVNEQEWQRPESLPDHDPDLWSAFGILGQSEQFMFHSPDSLEQRIEFVLNRPDQREILSAAARKRFVNRFTYTGFADRLLKFVRDGLA